MPSRFRAALGLSARGALVEERGPAAVAIVLRSSSGGMRVSLPSTLTIKSVPVWIAVFRASSAARCMATTEARRSGFWLRKCLGCSSELRQLDTKNSKSAKKDTLADFLGSLRSFAAKSDFAGSADALSRTGFYGDEMAPPFRYEDI